MSLPPITNCRAWKECIHINLSRVVNSPQISVDDIRHPMMKSSSGLPLPWRFLTFLASFFAEFLLLLGSMPSGQEGDMIERGSLDWCGWLAGFCFPSNSMCLPPQIGPEWRKAEIPKEEGYSWVKGREVDATNPQLESQSNLLPARPQGLWALNPLCILLTHFAQSCQSNTSKI